MTVLALYVLFSDGTTRQALTARGRLVHVAWLLLLAQTECVNVTLMRVKSSLVVLSTNSLIYVYKPSYGEPPIKEQHGHGTRERQI